MEYKLVRPSPHIEKPYMEYFQSWQGTGEPFVPWVSGLRGMKYSEWLVDIEKRGSNPLGSQVPASLMAFFAGDKIVGCLDLRHCLNAVLAKAGGHIGYGINPLHRGRGYAPLMLEHGLREARLIGLKEVLLTCHKTNIPSKCTIERCGGVFESEYVEPDGTVVLRYWIQTPDVL